METDRELTEKDFELLGRAVLLAGGAVALAKYSGTRGTAKEFDVLVDELEALRREQPDNIAFRGLPMDLLRRESNDLARDYSTDPTQGVYQDFKMAALNRLSQANEVLALKVPADQAAAFREGVIRVCERVAEESKEGGFLGIGATAVDYRESGVIEEIRRVLQV